MVMESSIPSNDSDKSGKGDSMFGLGIRKTALAFSLIIGIYACLFLFVGFDGLVSMITGSNREFVFLLLCTVIGWLAAWAMALRTVLGVLNVGISPQKGFLVFAGAMFFNNITPFGQAGGEPITAHLISRATNSKYETGLAAIASVDALNFVPSISIAFFGAVISYLPQH